MKRLSFLISVGLLICILLTSATTFAQGWNVELIGMKYDNWHDAQCIAYQGNYAYLGIDEDGMAVVDISELEDPMEVALYSVDWNPKDIEIVGNIVYVGCWNGGLHVFDISNPLIPVEIAMSPPEHINFLFIDGDLMYVSNWDEELTIMDISDPFNPEIVWVYSLGDGQAEVVIIDDIAYIGQESGGFWVCDVRDPFNLSFLGSIDLPGTIFGLRISGDYAYAVCGIGGLQIVDVTDPSNLFVVGTSLVNQNAVHVELEDNIAYVSGGHPGLYTIDVSIPTNPNILGQCDPGDYMHKFSLMETYLLSVNDGDGFSAIDISDPINPSLFSSYEPSWNITDVTVYGDYALVTADNDGLQVLDVSDPYNMFLAAYLDDIGAAQTITIAGNYAYIDCALEGFQIIDITDPTDPFVAANANIDGQICRIDEEEALAYVSGDMSNVLIYDISTPTNPTEIGSYTVPPVGYLMIFIMDVDINGQYLYALVNYYEPGEGGPLGDSLLVLDASDPTNPSFFAFNNAEGAPKKIEIANDYAYIAAEDPLLRVFNISDPTHPVMVGMIELPGNPNDLVLSGDYLYILRGYNYGLSVIDVSNPNNPVQTGYYDTPDSPKNVSVSGEIAYIADGDHFEIYDCSAALAFAVEITIVPMTLPVTIPAGGGSFDFYVFADNNGLGITEVDIWSEVILPNGLIQGPLLGPAGASLNPGSTGWYRYQNVPGRAPAGSYTYVACAGDYPETVCASDSLQFTKLATGDGDWVDDWNNWGDPIGGTEAVVSKLAPDEFTLCGTHPNPFNPVTTISFTLPEASQVNLAVYDVSGRLVATLVKGWRDAGQHEVTLDGSDLASGIYIYHLKTAEFTANGKMVLVK